MLNSEKILEGIRDDAPAVHDILMERYHYPSPKEQPTADQLLEILTEYDGDNWDVHYWSGRYAQMIECENEIQYWKDQYHYLDSRRTPDIDFV